MADANVVLGYEVGRLLSDAVTPSNLPDPAAAARFVHEVDTPLFVNGGGTWDWAQAGQHLQQMADAGRTEFPGLRDPVPLGIALRLWAGCIWAAKVIDRSGISRTERHSHFTEQIDPHARADGVFRAGVEAAPALNAIRGSVPPTLHGVPADSPVLRHLG